MWLAQNHVIQKLLNIKLEVQSIILNARHHHNDSTAYNDQLSAYEMRRTWIKCLLMSTADNVQTNAYNFKNTTYNKTTTAFNDETAAYNEICTVYYSVILTWYNNVSVNTMRQRCVHSWPVYDLDLNVNISIWCSITFLMCEWVFVWQRDFS